MPEAPEPISFADELAALHFLPDRKPEAAGQTRTDWATVLAPYRDGGIFGVHYAGSSQWERHSVGDEFVMVVDGATTMTLHIAGDDHRVAMAAGQFVVVPQGVWHRFDTPDGAKIVTITPQPTDHMIEHPSTLGVEA